MKRKPTSFQDIGGAVIVLCDDGTLWSLERDTYREPLSDEKNTWKWRQLPDIPQPTGEA